MSVDPKIIDRIEKLLRLAAPSTNSEHERTSAALEAARLFSEHPVMVAPKEKKKTQRRPKQHKHTASDPAPPPSPWASTVIPPDYANRPGWCRSVAARDSVCVDEDCGQPIYRGDPVWMRMSGFRVEYIHVGGPCEW